MTRCGCTATIKVLERAARPSGCCEPGTATRQSLVPGFFIFLGLPVKVKVDDSESKHLRWVSILWLNQPRLTIWAGWVEERNPTYGDWTSTQPAFHVNSPSLRKKLFSVDRSVFLILSVYSSSKETLSAITTSWLMSWGTPLTSSAIPTSISNRPILSNSVSPLV